jgi:hypothetical protein
MAGTGVAVTSGDLTPLLNDDGAGVYRIGRNNSRDIRVGLIGSNFLVGSDGFTPRPGVLVRSPAAGTDLQVVPALTPNQTVTIKKGISIIPRTGQGAYEFVNEADQVVSMPAASTVNNRIDVVCCAAFDKGAFVGDAAHGPQFWIEQGALSGTPVEPATPPGMLRLAAVLRATNDNAITLGEITDKRTSTSLQTGFRVQLPGDSPSDPGLYVGETRYTDLVYGPEVWTGTAWQNIGDVTIGGKRYTTGSVLATCTGPEILAGVNTGAIAYKGNKTYKITAQVGWDQSAGGDTFNWLFRETNLSGAVRVQQVAAVNNVNSVPEVVTFSFIFKPLVDITTTFAVSLSRITGSGTARSVANALGATFTEVVCKGLSGALTDV